MGDISTMNISRPPKHILEILELYHVDYSKFTHFLIDNSDKRRCVVFHEDTFTGFEIYNPKDDDTYEITPFTTSRFYIQSYLNNSLRIYNNV
jgi:hypothetical protein